MGTLLSFLDNSNHRQINKIAVSPAPTVSGSKEKSPVLYISVKNTNENDNKANGPKELTIGWLSPETCTRKRRSASLGNDDPWGWFADFEPTDSELMLDDSKFSEQILRRTRSLPNPATEPPLYILESSLAFQQLWYETAGRRPRQPPEERAHFEKLWEENFQKSCVEKKSISPKPAGREPCHQVIEDGEVIFRGDGPFSNAVSKCFQNFNFASMRLQVPKFRIHKFDSGEICAEYLVVVSLDHITFGVWKRHSDFKGLVTRLYAARDLTEFEFKNTILSWKCLLHKQRWFRCLDKDYLMLKCFLLERFMHDLLFESQSPEIISDFLGLT